MDTITEPPSGSTNPDAKLKRSLSLWQLTLLGVGTQIGSGWLFAVLGASSAAGAGAILSWIVGAALFVVISLTWIELGTMFPRSGALVRYPALSHGALANWFNGTGYWIGTVCLPAIEAQATLTYLGGSFPHLGFVHTAQGTTVLSWPNGILAGFGILIGFFLLNLFGVKLLAKVNTYVTIWKIVVPTLTFVLLLFAFKSSNLTAGGGVFHAGFSGVVQAIALGGIAFGYLGSRIVLEYAGEAKNPSRNIPLAVILSIIIPMFVYTGLQIGFIGALDWSDAGVAVGDWSALAASDWASGPLFDALIAAGFGSFATVLLIDAAVSPAGNGWVTMGAAARATFAFGADGYASSKLAKVNKFGIPWVSLVLAIVVSGMFMLPFPSWYELVSVVSVALVLNYLVSGPIAATLRRTAPRAHRGFRLPAIRFWAPAGYVAGMAIMYFAGFTSLVQLFVIVFAGLTVYGAYTSVNHGWVSKPGGLSISGAFLFAWVVTSVYGGWFMNTSESVRAGSWPFPVYFTAMLVAVAAFLSALWAVSTPDGRRNITGGVWLIATLLAVLPVSYYGEFGPLATPVLPEPYDLVVILAIGLVSYWWAVRSGFHTEQLDRVLNDDPVPTPREAAPHERREVADTVVGRTDHEAGTATS